ncbi:MAG: TonB-dependent receptor, partial [Steroidobacterales bacterium]
PSLTTFEGRAHSEFSMTESGDVSYEAGVAVGGPVVSDVSGFRVSGWYRSDGGYIDRINPQGASRDVNSSISKAARLSLTFAPGATVRITPSLYYQSVDVRDSSAFYTNQFHDLPSNLLNGNWVQQPSLDVFSLASIKLTAALRFGELTSVSSYYHRTADATIDTLSYDWGGWGAPLWIVGEFYFSGPAELTLDQQIYSQELRLASSDPKSRVTWVAGAFYSRGHAQEHDGPFSAAPLNMSPLGDNDGYGSVRENDEQLALFGHGTAALTDRLTASLGLRIAHAHYDSLLFAPVAATSGLPASLDVVHGERTIVPNVSLQYQPDPNKLLYATIAKGYRPGGANWPYGYCDVDLDKSFAPDSIWSYELGAKSSLLHERLRLSGSAFYIQWAKQEAVTFRDVTCKYIGNLTDAVSYGFDATAEALVTHRLKLGLSVAYTNVHYAETAHDGTTVLVSRGDAIGAPPVVPSPWNLRAMIDYRVPMTSGATAHFSAEDTFHSRIEGPFYTNSPFAYSLQIPNGLYRPDPLTNILNLRAGLSWPRFDLLFHVDNALNSQPTLLRWNSHTEHIYFDPRIHVESLVYATTFRPRTVGISANWQF